MNIKITRLIKKINLPRMQRFYDRGYVELGKMIRAGGCFYGCKTVQTPEAKAKVEQAIKRANWIYNACRGHGVFKSEI